MLKHRFATLDRMLGAHPRTTPRTTPRKSHTKLRTVSFAMSRINAFSAPARTLLRAAGTVAGGLVALTLFAATASAQAPATGGPSNSLGLPIDPSLLIQLPELKGVVSWSTLAQVKSRTEGKRVIPDFAPTVRALDKQEVKLQGFMLPIVTGERHDHFLLTMRPPHCPFCLSLGPEYIVEVRAKAPIKHTYDPVIVSGQLNVLSDDPFGLYYRLMGAQLSQAPR